MCVCVIVRAFKFRFFFFFFWSRCNAPSSSFLLFVFQPTGRCTTTKKKKGHWKKKKMAAVCSILAASARLCVTACLFFFFLAQRGKDWTWKKDPKCAVILTSQNQQRCTTPRRSTNAAGLALIYIWVRRVWYMVARHGWRVSICKRLLRRLFSFFFLWTFEKKKKAQLVGVDLRYYF